MAALLNDLRARGVGQPAPSPAQRRKLARFRQRRRQQREEEEEQSGVLRATDGAGLRDAEEYRAHVVARREIPAIPAFVGKKKRRGERGVAANAKVEFPATAGANTATTSTPSYKDRFGKRVSVAARLSLIHI